VVGRGRSGVEPLVEQRELFVSLIAAGVSNSAACRQVGVNRKDRDPLAGLPQLVGIRGRDPVCLCWSGGCMGG
jgi:hypothetical protein